MPENAPAPKPDDSWEAIFNERVGRTMFRKDLFSDPDTGMLVRLVRYPAGFITPLHTHPCGHGMYILEGTLVTHKGAYGPGSFVWFPEGEMMEHGASADGDVTAVFITNKPFRIDYVTAATEQDVQPNQSRPNGSTQPVAFIADIGTVLRLTPHDDLQIASGDGVYLVSDDRTPFYFQVQGHLYDGQLFYGLFGPVLSGPSRFEGLICNILVRTDATDWRNETQSQVNFKVGRSVVTRNHHEHFSHPDGTLLEGYPRISRFGLVEVVHGENDLKCSSTVSKPR